MQDVHNDGAGQNAAHGNDRIRLLRPSKAFKRHASWLYSQMRLSPPASRTNLQGCQGCGACRLLGWAGWAAADTRRSAQAACATRDARAKRRRPDIGRSQCEEQGQHNPNPSSAPQARRRARGTRRRLQYCQTAQSKSEWIQVFDLGQHHCQNTQRHVCSNSFLPRAAGLCTSCSEPAQMVPKRDTLG